MGNKPFFAMIIPMGDTPGGGGGPGDPPHVWAPTFPTNPIVVPPGGAYPGGGRPPYPTTGPGFPTNPIAEPPWGWGRPQPPGTPPLVIWGGGGVGDYIDAGFPGPQPGKPPQIWGGPYFPPVIWDPASPTNPIVNPGDPDHPGGPATTPKIEWKTAWSPQTGWVIVGVPTGEHVTPSAAPTEAPAA